MRYLTLVLLIVLLCTIFITGCNTCRDLSKGIYDVPGNPTGKGLSDAEKTWFDSEDKCIKTCNDLCNSQDCSMVNIEAIYSDSEKSDVSESLKYGRKHNCWCSCRPDKTVEENDCTQKVRELIPDTVILRTHGQGNWWFNRRVISGGETTMQTWKDGEEMSGIFKVPDDGFGKELTDEFLTYDYNELYFKINKLILEPVNTISEDSDSLQEFKIVSYNIMRCRD